MTEGSVGSKETINTYVYKHTHTHNDVMECLRDFTKVLREKIDVKRETILTEDGRTDRSIEAY